MLRPHSDRLNNVFKSWLRSGEFLPQIQDIANIPEGVAVEVAIVSKPAPPSPYALHFALQHLESGYPQVYLELKEIEGKIEHHNKRTADFFNRLYERVRKELKLPEPPADKRYAYYGRLISYSLRKTLTGYPESEPEIIQTDQSWQLRWNGAHLVIGTRKDCEKGFKSIDNLRRSEDVVSKAKNLYEAAEKLKIEREKTREQLHLKITDNLEVGGIIKGQCEACP